MGGFFDIFSSCGEISAQGRPMSDFVYFHHFPHIFEYILAIAKGNEDITSLMDFKAVWTFNVQSNQHNFCSRNICADFKYTRESLSSIEFDCVFCVSTQQTFQV